MSREKIRQEVSSILLEIVTILVIFGPLLREFRRVM